MNLRSHRFLAYLAAGASAFLLALSPASAQGTSFTYQGRLDADGTLANGIFDLQFRVFDAVTNGFAQGSVVTISDLGVSNGLFAVQLDFGAGVFTGASRWLDIAVRPGDSTDAFVSLHPRQPVSPAPYAIFAGGAAATGLTGTLPSGALSGTYGSAVLFTNSANAFAGNGRGLTQLNATNLFGTIAGGQLPANVALLNRATQAFTGNTHSFAGDVGIGATTPQTPLHVYSGDNPTVLRLQSSAGFGAGKVEFWSDPMGSDNEWRPASIVSTDNGGYTGGLAFLVNGSGASNRQSEREVMRLVNGRVGIGTNNPGARLHVVASSGPTNVGVFVGDRAPFGSAIFQTDFNQTNVTHAWFAERGAVVFSVADGGQGYFKGNVGIGTSNPSSKLHVVGEVTMVACNITSDRNAKEQFKPVNSREVLDKVASLPISEWQYKSQPDARHIGPMAQDFRDAFTLGRDEKHITTVDADGIALAAIQGLNEKLEQELAAKGREVDSLRASVRELRERVDRLLQPPQAPSSDGR